MTIGDFLSIYVVSLDKPFIFWESELLESLILISVMVLDVAYDFYWLVIWVLVSVDNKYLTGFGSPLHSVDYIVISALKMTIY